MIRVDVINDQITAAFVQAARKLDDLTPLMQEIGEYLLESSKENFRTGSAPDGTPWAPRSPVTLAAYEARGERPKGGPLVGVSRALSTTITYEAGPDSVEWGSNMIYAAVMQFGAAQGAFGATARGSPIPWGTIPARPFLGIGADDEAEITDLIAEHLAL